MRSQLHLSNTRRVIADAPEGPARCRRHVAALADRPLWQHEELLDTLRDLRADVELEDVKVEVNGRPVRLGVSQRNYYDRRPYDRLDHKDNFSLTPESDYRFVLILPVGTRHDIGWVRTPAALAREQFSFSPASPTSGPVTIVQRSPVAHFSTIPR